MYNVKHWGGLCLVDLLDTDTLTQSTSAGLILKEQ